MVPVPYKGSADMLTATVAGDLTFYVDTAVAAGQHIKSGRLRALGVTSIRRIATLPEVPTLDELGVKGFDMPNWLVLMAPAAIPPGVRAALEQAFNGLLNQPQAREQLSKLGLAPRGDLDRAALEAYMRSEMIKWKEAAQAAGVKKQQ
jgi:tripartite-type tricarboxylate transporter receptor subunit TctC